MFSSLFNTILYQPIFNVFIGFYNIIPTHDAGLVILIMTFLIRVLVYPLTSQAIKSQKSMQELQPKMQAVKEKYKDDQQKQATALMELYKEHKVNPLTSCLPILIQLPILIALYMVLRDGLVSSDLSKNLYSFVANPGVINPLAFGFLDLKKTSIVLAVLAGVAQYFQAANMLTSKAPSNAGKGALDENMTAMMNKQMKYMMPVLTVFIGMGLPSGLTLYWFFSTLLTWLQQKLLTKKPSDSDTTIINSTN